VDKNTLNYKVDRDCGLFSNITVCMYGIMKYNSLGYLPETISLYLNEYKHDYDFYNDLFKLNPNKLSFDDISEDEMFNFFRYCEPNFLGLGRRKNEVNFKILNRVLNKYFTLSDGCDKILSQIISKHKIDLHNTVFLWARKTDKVYETGLPSASRYIDVLRENNLLDKDIILQTDDRSVLNEFKSSGINFRTLEEIPYSDVDEGFHVKMSIKYNDAQFIEKYNMSKTEYLQKLLSLSKLASMCEYSIIYPGCLTTFIPILKGDFINKFSFANSDFLLV
jgi:hypothetical protein